MKYVILSIAALAAVFGLSFLIAGLVRRRLTRKPPVAVHILIAAGAGILVLGGAAAVFLNIHYPAQDIKAFAHQSGVTVTDTDGGYFINGSGTDKALIFYPGAMVDADAYLPLMTRIAESGTDCFLPEMPARMAIFDANAADKIRTRYDYDTWILAGHSMGGMIAAKYAATHKGIDGVVLLAAYPIDKLSDTTALLSVYGTDDTVLERDAYESAKADFPARTTEVVIAGGNHAQFGNYGAQSGDGEAHITREEQQRQTVEAIKAFANIL
ncbi:MAG: alpha/beta fold hydrolase [Ruminococcus sp.]|nr:alpha/beta fold hydrolase [Ruminococcus sp.]